MGEVVDVEVVHHSIQSAGDSAGAETVNKMVAPTLRVEELKSEGATPHLSSPDYTSSEDGASDPGVTNDSSLESAGKNVEAEFVRPDAELSERIVKQVEFYFSDANIVKDAFLLKHVRRHKCGYVSLKLITSFKKMKSLTKDYRVVAYALGNSEKLMVNDEGTKVRRLAPLPDYDETAPSRTVVAVNVSSKDPSIEHVAEIFKACGEISLIRILRPGKPIPVDIKRHMNKHPEFNCTICAVVEYENHAAAMKACETLSNKDDWRSGMRVVPLTIKKAEENGGEEKTQPEEKKKKKKTPKRKNSRVHELRDNVSPNVSSGSEGELSDTPQNQQPCTLSEPILRPPRSSLSPHPDTKLLSPNGSPRSSPINSPRGSPRNSPTSRRKYNLGRSPLAADFGARVSPGASPRHTPQGSPEMRRKKDSDETGSSPSSPWVQRRLRAQQQQEEAAGGLLSSSPGTSPLAHRHFMGSMMGVTRQPRGPDGTSGFSGAGRGKHNPASGATA